MNERKQESPGEHMLKFVACGILFPVWIAEASGVWTSLASLHF